MHCSPILDDESRDLRGLPSRYGPEVRIRESIENRPGARYPILHKEYETPHGTLHVAVNKTDDWPYGDHVPFLDDYIEPRTEKHLITGPEDLPALRHLLRPPTPETVSTCSELWRKPKEFAMKHDLLVAGGRGVLGDALAWLCGKPCRCSARTASSFRPWITSVTHQRRSGTRSRFSSTHGRDSDDNAHGSRSLKTKAEKEHTAWDTLIQSTRSAAAVPDGL